MKLSTGAMKDGRIAIEEVREPWDRIILHAHRQQFAKAQRGFFGSGILIKPKKKGSELLWVREPGTKFQTRSHARSAPWMGKAAGGQGGFAGGLRASEEACR